MSNQPPRDYSSNWRFLLMRRINRILQIRYFKRSIDLQLSIGKLLLPKAQGAIIIPTVHGFVIRIDLDTSAGDLRGSIERNLYYLGTYERGTLKVIQSHLPKNGSFIDVGAHYGVMSLFVSSLEPATEVVAIEPNSHSFTLLRENIRINQYQRITSVKRALGAKPRKVFLRHDRGNTGAARVVRDGRSDEVVQMTTLDRLVSSRRLKKISLIKIDVEGLEYDVLAGAKQTIAQHRPLLIIEFANQKTKLLRFLDQIGYVPYRLARSRHHRSKLERYPHRYTDRPMIDNLYCFPDTQTPESKRT